MLMKQKQSKWKIIFITGSWILVKMELTWIAGGGVWNPLISCFPAVNALHWFNCTILSLQLNVEWQSTNYIKAFVHWAHTAISSKLQFVDCNMIECRCQSSEIQCSLSPRCSLPRTALQWLGPGSGPCCISHSQHCLVSPGTSCLSSLLSPRLLCHPSMLQGHWHPASHDRLLHKQCDGGDVTSPHPTTLIVTCVLSRWYLTFEFKLTYYKLIWENKSNMPYAGDLAVDNLVQLQLRFFIARLSHPPGSCLHLSL